MSDTHTAPAHGTENAVQPNTFRRHAHRIWQALGVLAACAIVILGWYTYGPYLSVYGQKTVLTIQQTRQQSLVNAGKVATIEPTVTTEATQTDTGRAVIVETTKTVIDPVAELNSLKASAAKAQEKAATQIAALTSAVTDLTKKFSESTASRAPANVVANAEQPAPARQSTAQSSSGDTEIVMPKGFHVTTVGDASNQAKLKKCTGRLEPIMDSPQCYTEGKQRICPARCVK